MFIKLFSATGTVANRPAGIEAQINAYLHANPNVSVLTLIEVTGATNTLNVLAICTEAAWPRRQG